ncbi:hypothetical protein J1N35_028332 [Gossypium stocksii]|uniref:Uncharacterized protein n=1 Tax=Gossypium stocksii TaxID=47602 RepID=A0A9D3UVW1_9ROSI|nr:hypothetical protein J1N35_028332 [Gossypium stocksii]
MASELRFTSQLQSNPSCYEDNVTQCITGTNGVFPPSLPHNFSIDALFSRRSSLSNLNPFFNSLGLWDPLPATIGYPMLKLNNATNNWRKK